MKESPLQVCGQLVLGQAVAGETVVSWRFARVSAGHQTVLSVGVSLAGDGRACSV